MIINELIHTVQGQKSLDFSSSSGAQKFYSYLKAGNCWISLTYQEDQLAYLFTAVSKKQDFSFTIKVKEKNAVPLFYAVDAMYYARAFVQYLMDSEENLDEDALQKRYGIYYGLIRDSLTFSKEDLENRRHQMVYFHRLLETISQPEEEEPKPIKEQPAVDASLYYRLSSVGSESIDLQLSALIKDKEHLIKDVPGFLTALVSGKPGKVKNNLYTDLSHLPKEDQEIVPLLIPYFLSERNSYSKNKISSDLLFRIINSQRGKTVEYMEEEYVVDKETVTPVMEIQDDGMLHREPHEGEVLLTHGRHCVFLGKDHHISILEFHTSREARFFEFADENRDFRFDLFQSEMASSVLPMLKGDVKVSEAYRKRHPYQKEQIEYYIDYQEDNTIKLKTLYQRGDTEITKELFVSKPMNQQNVDAFERALDHLGLPENGVLEDPEEILSLLKADLSALKNQATVLLSEEFQKKKVVSVGKIQVRTESGIDWLKMSFESSDYTPEELSDIIKAFKKKKKFIRLKDSVIDLEDEKAADLFAMLNDFDVSGVETEKLPLYQALKLPSYQGEDIDVAYSDEVKTLLNDIRDFKQEQVSVSDEALAKMRPYQVDGVKWLHVLVRHSLSGILADDMGLGKTFEMITLLSLDPSPLPVLAVTPKSLIYNWQNEFGKWNPSQPTIVLDGDKANRTSFISKISKNKKRVVYITSYESLRNDLDSFDDIRFSYLILDEGQNISNVYAKKTRAVKTIRAEHHFVLTGTPIQNSLMDLWSIFDFLMPGYLASYKEFYKTYGKLKLEDEDLKEDLMKKIAPFVLKRTKNEVLKDLPPKDEQVMTIAMNEEQRKYYDAYLQNTKSSMNLSDPSNKIVILAALTRLRQLCVDPKTCIPEYESEAVKLSVALKMIKDAIPNGHKVLVFSAFAQVLFHFQEQLEKEGISSYLIYGQTSAQDRIAQANAFNDKDDAKVMLVSLKAGGTGLNLVGADIVLHLDPWWNLAAENQATDRAHRIGQKRAVTVVKLVCKDSVEEKVLELQQKKKELAGVVQDGDSGITNMDTDDLRFLLS